MQIFLQILAVLGIVLLSLIGIALLLIALVLFVPIRYKVRASKDDAPVADVRITWLLHLLSVKYLYPEPGEIVLRILGIKAWKMKPGGEQETETEAGEETKDGPSKAEGELQESVKAEQSKEKPSETEGEKSPQETKKTELRTAEIPKETEGKPRQATETEPKPEQKTGFFERLQYKIKSICDKIKKVLADYQYYRDLLQKKENRLLFERCKVRILKILKSIRPRVLKADLVVGTGAPDTTGYLLAVYGMLLPLFGNHINITPDFENAIFKGRVYIKGRITIFTILLNGAKIYFDKQLHQLIDNLKRKDV